MKRKKIFSVLSFLTFLLVFSALTPAVVYSWANPLATDPIGDGTYFGDDILSVDAQYVNEFVYFRFKMNDPLILYRGYGVIVDFDKNISTGDYYYLSDIGFDFLLYAVIDETSPDIRVAVGIQLYDGTSEKLLYNMTANNGSAMDWTDPNIIPCLDLAIFANGSQGDVAFGVNWTWLTVVMELEGVAGDGCSMYLEFVADEMADWCPDRTGGTADYIEWNFCSNGGIPGFSTTLALFCLLSMLAVIILRNRKRVTV